jgi:hypothetical protein
MKRCTAFIPILAGSYDSRGADLSVVFFWLPTISHSIPHICGNSAIQRAAAEFVFLLLLTFGVRLCASLFLLVPVADGPGGLTRADTGAHRSGGGFTHVRFSERSGSSFL